MTDKANSVRKVRAKRAALGLKVENLIVHPDHDADLIKEFKERSIGNKIWRRNLDKRGPKKKAL